MKSASNNKKSSVIEVIIGLLTGTLFCFISALVSKDFREGVTCFAEDRLGIPFAFFSSIVIFILIGIIILLALLQMRTNRTASDHPNLTADPPRPRYMIGRNKDLKAVRKKLLSGKKNVLLLVNGKGGIGKTTLAAHYYHCYKNRYRYRGWVLSEKSIINSLLDLSPALEIRFEEKLSQQEKLKILLTQLANLEEPCLLVIDNANEVDDLESSCLALRKCSNFHILLTTRITSFENVPSFQVDGLKEKYAIKLFKRYYPTHNPSEDALLKQIITEVERNTLIIELLAKNLQNINKLEPEYSLNQLHKDINQSLVHLSKSKEISTAYRAKGSGLRNEHPEAIVLAMYDLRELTEAEKQMISIFSALPNEAIPFQQLKALLPNQSIKDTVLKLAQKGWIDFDEQAKNFKINQVVQDVVKERQKDRLPGDCIDLIRSVTEYLSKDNILHREQIDHTLLLVRYAESISTAIQINIIELGILSQYIGDFHTQTGDLSRSLSSYKKMSATLRELLNNDEDNPDFKNGLAISYERLGSTHTALGNLDQALTFFEDYLKLSKELYEVYPQNVSFKHDLAISYGKLGETHTELGNLDQALTFFEDETILFKELYEAYPKTVSFKNGLAFSYGKLGETHTALGNLDQALTFFEDGTVLFKELYEASPQNVSFKHDLAVSYSKLGSTHTALGNLDLALTFFEDSLKLRKELYEASPQNVFFKNGLAISYSKLGSTHTTLGNLDLALTFFEDYLKLSKKLYEAYPQNVSFKNGLAISYGKLGEMHTALGNLDLALTFFKDYLKLSKELYEATPQNVSFKNGLAFSYVKLGEFFRDQNHDKNSARIYFEKAWELWSQLVKEAPKHVSFQRFFQKVQKELNDL